MSKNPFYVENFPTFLGSTFKQELINVSPTAVGTLSPPILQPDCSVAMAPNAGYWHQGECAIAIGEYSGHTLQGDDSIAIGSYSGNVSQGIQAIAMGLESGKISQGLGSVAIGSSSGMFSQKSFAIALGYQAGRYYQGTNTIAIGYQAGNGQQNLGAIAIGTGSAIINQGTYAIAVGHYSAQTNQCQKSIVLNATGENFPVNQEGLFISPVRETTELQPHFLVYNPSTHEIQHIDMSQILGEIQALRTELNALKENVGSNPINEAITQLQTNVTNNTAAINDFMMYFNTLTLE